MLRLETRDASGAIVIAVMTESPSSVLRETVTGVVTAATPSAGATPSRRAATATAASPRKARGATRGAAARARRAP